MPPPCRLLVLLCLLCGCSNSVPDTDVVVYPLGTIVPQGSAEETPLLGLPVYLRTGDGETFWTLDTSRKSVIGLGRDGTLRGISGTEGRGPGEIRIALGMDLARDGSHWVADPGNGKVVGYRGGEVIGEFMVNHQPLGIAAVDDGSIWVGGDLIHSVLRRYDRSGNVIGAAGVPVDSGAAAMRLNQGVAARGTGPCAVVWAYTFRSILECYSPSGETVWRSEGPTSVRPARDADPYQMSPGERFAYLDVTAWGGKVYGLFVGGPPADDGLRTGVIHVFDAATGTYSHIIRLPDPGKYIVRHDTVLAVMDYDPEPLIRLYRLPVAAP